jgi:thiosulfate/3-mercaptopyruvate sulfurtransferase
MRKMFVVIVWCILLVGTLNAGSRNRYARPEMLVETNWLADHVNDPQMRIVDARSIEVYANGHIPGAVHLDTAKLRTKDDEAEYIPLPEEFVAMMGELGISNKTRVVIYDDRGGVLGVRLWYVLDYYGHRKVGLLNGGWNKWMKEERPVTTEPPIKTKTEFKVKPQPQVVCTLDQMKVDLKKSNTVIVDARSIEEYTGENKQNNQRGGHIPGAVNIEWKNNLTADGTFKSAQELRRLYEQAGLTPDKEIVTYCQSGGRASHTLFALRLIGFDKSRNYYGSWQEWSNREDTPVETPDSKPKIQD